jgi:YggT family protein
MLSIIFLLDRLIWLYELMVIVRCVISFFPVDAYNPIIRFITQITEPLMDAVRKAFPFLLAGGLDLSPIVILFLLDFTRRYIASTAAGFLL